MPETMSPREKVAVIVEAAILRHFPSAVISDTLDDASDILAALASSGDHAELAGLAEADQVIRDIAETPYSGADWPRSRAATYLASKEAERG